MRVDIYSRKSKTIFDDLAIGDCYRTENGSSIYMKIKGSSSINTVAIDSGHTFKHNGTYRVYRVSGVFKEEPYEEVY